MATDRTFLCAKSVLKRRLSLHKWPKIPACILLRSQYPEVKLGYYTNEYTQPIRYRATPRAHVPAATPVSDAPAAPAAPKSPLPPPLQIHDRIHPTDLLPPDARPFNPNGKKSRRTATEKSIADLAPGSRLPHPPSRRRPLAQRRLALARTHPHRQSHPPHRRPRRRQKPPRPRPRRPRLPRLPLPESEPWSTSKRAWSQSRISEFAEPRTPNPVPSSELPAPCPMLRASPLRRRRPRRHHSTPPRSPRRRLQPHRHHHRGRRRPLSARDFPTSSSSSPSSNASSKPSPIAGS